MSIESFILTSGSYDDIPGIHLNSNGDYQMFDEDDYCDYLVQIGPIPYSSPFKWTFNVPDIIF